MSNWNVYIYIRVLTLFNVLICNKVRFKTLNYRCNDTVKNGIKICRRWPKLYTFTSYRIEYILLETYNNHSHSIVIRNVFMHYCFSSFFCIDVYHIIINHLNSYPPCIIWYMYKAQLDTIYTELVIILLTCSIIRLSY